MRKMKNKGLPKQAKSSSILPKGAFIKRKPKPLPAQKLIGFLKDHRPLEFEREPDREF